MDIVEQIRQSAANLHNALSEKGIDPLQPLLIANAALEHLDLLVNWLPLGDPALLGAQALFDQQSGTILCGSQGSSGERALLIAHEIGHACLHAGSSSCSEGEIDPSRTVETAPVGLQRVEDYGVRERRELHANVFARELIFPRTLARRLYLGGNSNASEIAQKMELPLIMVRQQLFDALLLPPILPAPAASEEPKETFVPMPDPSQDRAAAHRGSPFQLQAGPGTGKTRTLIKRVLSLLTDGIDPNSILVLTFSNRAAGELVERLSLSVPEAATRIWVGTFHAFGLDLVRRYHDRLDLPANPEIFDQSDAVEVLEEILPTLPFVHYKNLWDPALVLREMVSAISRAKDEMTDPICYKSLAQNMVTKAKDIDSLITAEKCLEVSKVYELYERALHDRRSVDFGDLIMRPTLLLESDPTLQQAVQLRHRHVLVDEYQDVNRASGRLLKAIAGDGSRLWVVGDSRQSIYRFRGASSVNMTLFPSEYPGTNSDQLNINYRSTDQVVQTLKAVAPRMSASAGMLPLDLTAMRGLGPSRVEIRKYGQPEEETAGIAASIEELRQGGIPYCGQAILCRSNGRMNEIAASLEARGIPILHFGSLFERHEVRGLLALLSLAAEPFGDGLIRVVADPRYGVPLQDAYVAAKHIRDNSGPVLRTLTNLAEIPGLSPDGARGLASLAADLGGLSTMDTAWSFLSMYLLDRTDLIKKLSEDESVTGRMRAVAVWQFLNYLRSQSPTGKWAPIRHTLDKVRQLVLFAEERDLRQIPAAALHLDAVRIMTVHGSKGLEFEAVHVPGLTVAGFPLSNRAQRCPPPAGMVHGTLGIAVADGARQAHDQEEECLFFVAISRARTHLRLYLAQLQADGRNRTPSPFLGWLPAHNCNEILRPPIMALPKSMAPEMIAVSFQATWPITDRRLVSFEKCPRRFFYTHCLGLGNARKRTAFSQTHDCIHELIRWLATIRISSSPTVEMAQAQMDKIWEARGPVGHAFAQEYHQLATAMTISLISFGKDRIFTKAEPIPIKFPNGQVIVEPNEQARMPNGRVVLRRVQTGRQHSDESGRLEYTLYHAAGQAKFGANYEVEAIHLADDKVGMVPVTQKKASTRLEKSNAMLGKITAGIFPADSDPTTCPRCPHFFICGTIPKGSLAL